MAYVLGVKIPNSIYNLPEDSFAGIFTLSLGALVLEVLLQTDPTQVFHDQINCLFLINDLVQLDDIGVVKASEDLHFSGESPAHITLLHLVLIVHFNGYFLFTPLVRCKFNNG